jgi:hypothetical protein
MEIYDDGFSKIALTLTATQVAKNILTKEDGIGSEIPFNFFFWKYDIPILCIQMSQELMAQSQAKRFEYSSSLLSIIRMSLGITGVTFIAEGYVAKEPQEKELNLAFLEPKSTVKECLAVIHCELIRDFKDPQICMFSLPYSYGLNKKINWDGLTAFSENALDIVKKYSYPKMIMKVMNKTPFEPGEELPEEIRNTITRNGFYIQEF